MKKVFLKSTGQEVFPTGHEVVRNVPDQSQGRFKEKLNTQAGFKEASKSGFKSSQYMVVGIPTGNTKPGSKRLNIVPVLKSKLKIVTSK